MRGEQTRKNLTKIAWVFNTRYIVFSFFSEVLSLPRPPVHTSFAREEETECDPRSSILEDTQAMLSSMLQHLFHLLCHTNHFSISICRSVNLSICFKKMFKNCKKKACLGIVHKCIFFSKVFCFLVVSSFYLPYLALASSSVKEKRR